MNINDTALTYICLGGAPYSNSNPASIYIQFVRPELEPAAIVSMMTTHKANMNAEKSARALRAAAAKLREEEGGEEPGDDLSEALKRRRELNKLNSSAAGSVKKKKRSPLIPTHERFKPGVEYLAWPRGGLVCDVTPDHPRVKWEVVTIYNHLSACTVATRRPGSLSTNVNSASIRMSLSTKRELCVKSERSAWLLVSPHAASPYCARSVRCPILARHISLLE